MTSDHQRLHADVEAIGIRASGAAIGLFQLLKELLEAGVLTGDAVGRIKEAVISDLSATRPRSQTLADYQKRVRDRMDALVPIAAEHQASLRH